jgi:hypothetical protein
MKRFINRLKEWFKKEGTETIDLQNFKETIFNYTKAFKFNKVVSSFMILLNKNKHLNLKTDCKNEITKLLEIYMPDVKNKINK